MIKKYLSGFVFALALAPVAAFASVDVTSVSVAPDPVEEGQSVTVTIEGQKTSNACNNNWGYTKVFLDSVQIGTTTLNSFTGTGTTTDTFAFNASGVGSHQLYVEAWSGAEDFAPADGNPDCTDTFLDSDSVNFDVDAVPAPSSPSTPSTQSTGGGGCGTDLCRYNNLFVRDGNWVQNPSALHAAYISLAVRLWDIILLKRAQ